MKLETTQEASTDFEENECPGCGLKRDEWGTGHGPGFLVKGRTYCCQGCAEETGCQCSARIVEKVSQHPGVQVFDHGQLHSDRRHQQVSRPGLPERRLSRASGFPPLS